MSPVDDTVLVNPTVDTLGPVGTASAAWAALAELDPMLRRAVDLSPLAVVRLLAAASPAGPAVLTALIRLPFEVLVGRAVAVGGAAVGEVGDGLVGLPGDSTFRAADLLDTLEDNLAGAEVIVGTPLTGGRFPPRRDQEWRGSVPPRTGWQRIDTVPGDVVRSLVTAGARALAEAAAREGIPGAQPRAEVTTALLDSVVLTVSDRNRSSEVALRTLSAVVRMGFLPPGGSIAVDVCGRWSRVVAPFGTAYAEVAQLGLALRG